MTRVPMSTVAMFHHVPCICLTLAIVLLLSLATASSYVAKVSASATPWPKDGLAIQKDEILPQERQLLGTDDEENANTSSTEAEILLRFREAITGDPDGILDSWNATQRSKVCRWSGVACDTTNHVSTLNLSDHRLAGKISPSLGSLSSLSSLILAGNSFAESIPSSLGRLQHLRHLDLSRNNLTSRIPLEISNCSLLTYLNFSTNNLSGFIPKQLSNLKNLSHIGLDHNQLGASIPRELGNCSSLQNLDLSWNQLTGTIPNELGRLRRLTSLLLTSNLLSGSVPKSLSNCTSLTSLSLNTNSLTGTIPQELGELKGLQHLALLDNIGLGGSIPSSLGNLTSLATLELGCLPSFAGWVSTIILQYCALTGIIPPELGKLRNLSFFGITASNVTGNIPEELGNLSNVTRIFIAFNQLTGRIPSALGNLSTLLTLSLDGNYLEGEIPSSLGGLENVGWLAFRNNQLTGNVPAELGNLTMIYRLLLSRNRLSGPVIVELGKLATIRELSLDYNEFSGELPSALGNCSLLGQLFLSHNNISGSLPVDMTRSMTALYNLSFSNNQLSGSIPGEIGSMKSLEYLNLSSNNLSGPIPPNIEKCQDLSTLDISNNHLSGPLPIAALESLLYIEDFTVANNDLEGAIPARVGAFVNVTADSYAGNAELCGPLLGKNCSSISTGGCHGIGGACHRVWIYVVSGAAIVLVTVIIGTMLLLFCRKPSGKDVDFDASGNEIPFDGKSTEDMILKTTNYVNNLKLTMEDLWAATGGFSEFNVLGMGGQSTVYKAVLPHGDGTIFAVKRMRVDPRETPITSSTQNLYHELQILEKMRHRNLVKVHGYCVTQNSTALLMEYIANGSLQSHLHSSQLDGEAQGNYDGVQLTLETRMRIASDVADAMAYMHHECHEPVIHSDLKPSNILLDYEFNAKITDFGISRYVRKDSINKEATVSALYGTTGYIPPEYATSNKVSTKGDVYSYGVVLLELLTGKRPTDPSFAEDGTWLADWVLNSFPHRIADILDDRLKGDFEKNTEQIGMLIRVGLLCTREKVADRPSMQDIQTMLAQVSELSKSELSKSEISESQDLF